MISLAREASASRVFVSCSSQSRTGAKGSDARLVILNLNTVKTIADVRGLFMRGVLTHARSSVTWLAPETKIRGQWSTPLRSSDKLLRTTASILLGWNTTVSPHKYLDRRVAMLLDCAIRKGRGIESEYEPTYRTACNSGPSCKSGGCLHSEGLLEVR
jgi:hypothetical protein